MCVHVSKLLDPYTLCAEVSIVVQENNSNSDMVVKREALRTPQTRLIRC